MNRVIKSISAFAAVSAMLLTNVSAAVLGILESQSVSPICKDVEITSNVFVSEQAGVGKQTEYYCEYTPNSGVRPVVINGESIWGRRTLLQASEYMQNNGLVPMLGINADFFSTKTGIPMSHTIMNGEVVTKDITGQDAIGFREDGTAFMGWLEIQTVLSTAEQNIYIDNINKYRQPGAYPAFLLTDKFGDNTQASTWGIDVLIGSVEGKMGIGETVTGVIEDIGYNDGAIAIPDGKMVLTMDCNGNADIYAQIQNLKIGQTVTVTNTAVYNQELWQTAESGIGSIGGRLLKNGETGTGFEKGTAPRTAIGITAEGKIIFYVLDGRQKGYSYGAKIETVAQRMKELGCVDAINLDGGGSTTIGGVYPGSSAMSVVNSPSDGSQRKVANFIFLQNTAEPTGIAGSIYLSPSNKYYLNGSTEKITAAVLDTANHAMENPSDMIYSIKHTTSTVSADGTVTFDGEGEVIVAAESPSSGAYGLTSLYTYSTPTDMYVKNQATGEDLRSFTGNMGESIDFTVVSYAGEHQLISQDSAYDWVIEGDIGTIDENGLLMLAENPGAEGRVWITAGGMSASVDVKINDVNAKDKYPQIYVEEERDFGVIGITSTTLSDTLSAQDIILRIDGNEITDVERIQFNEKYAGINFTAPDGFFENGHKICIEVKNSAGLTSVYNYTVGTGKVKADYADTDGHWAENEIAVMSGMGIVQGEEIKNKKYFKPDNAMTRAEFAVMMCNYLKIDSSGYADVPFEFEDRRTIPSWAENQIKAMYSLHIMNGKKTDTGVKFESNASVTRAEVMTVLSRIMPEGLYEGELNFADNSDIPSWAVSGVSRLVNSGVVSGYADNTILPLKNITRAEALRMLYNVM